MYAHINFHNFILIFFFPLITGQEQQNEVDFIGVDFVCFLLKQKLKKKNVENKR
jgi:hypothetical protein